MTAISLPLWTALLVAAPPVAVPGGLGGGPRLGPAPEALRVEGELLEILNHLRAKAKLSPLTLDPRLRAFAREMAAAAARGDDRARRAADEVRRRGLAPFGFRLYFAYGTHGRAILRDLQREPEARRSLRGAFSRVGVGAFWVPERRPYAQVVLLLVADPDPMAGKPGLSPAQTDPVMHAAAERIRDACYDRALERNPNLRGDLIFQLVIGGEGRVTEARLLRTMGDAIFERCALEVVRQRVFPKPYRGKSVTLNHPMHFEPPQGARRIGKLSPAQVSGAFARSSDAFRACYDRARKDRPELAGVIEIALDVSPEGVVQHVRVERDGPGDAILRACVLEVTRRLVFPRPRFGGVARVRFPLRFEPAAKE